MRMTIWTVIFLFIPFAIYAAENIETRGSLKEIDIIIDGKEEIIKLSQNNLIKTCTLQNESKSYAVTYGDKIANKNINWRVSVLGKYESDLLAFIAISFIKTGSLIQIKNFTYIWHEEQWQDDKILSREKISEFMEKNFKYEEFKKLYDCTFNAEANT